MHVIVLVFYCSYAISPIYLSAVAGRNDWTAECGHLDRNVTIGIVWVNVLLSKLVGSGHSQPAAPTELHADDREREFILIKKKRDVLRETIRIKPVLVKLAESRLAESPVPTLSCTCDTPHPANYLHDDLTISRHAGLSPPLRPA